MKKLILFATIIVALATVSCKKDKAEEKLEPHYLGMSWEISQENDANWSLPNIKTEVRIEGSSILTIVPNAYGGDGTFKVIKDAVYSESSLTFQYHSFDYTGYSKTTSTYERVSDIPQKYKSLGVVKLYKLELQTSNTTWFIGFKLP